MNISMHSTTIVDVYAYNGSAGIAGAANFAEMGGRTGTASLFFDSADACQAAADALAELAQQMREQQEQAA